MNGRTASCFLMIFLVSCSVLLAQGFSGDARRIAMGGIGYTDNLASKMIEDEREYRSIIIPLGLFQLLGDLDRFDPDDKDKFDPILGMEYAANPLYLVFGRDPGGPRGQLISDVINGDFRWDYRDLNTYRGFIPTNHLLSEGLVNPSWGKSIKLWKRQDGSFQSFYVGVGPYLSAKTDLNIHQGLIDILRSPTPLYKANQSFMVEDNTEGQLALDVTLGYRARFALPGKIGGKSKRNGLYTGMNYHYLKGFAYQNPDITLRFDTDRDGLVILNPTTVPVVIDHRYSRSGSGFALDLGIGLVTDHWEFGFGSNGLGNRINWDELNYKQFRMLSWSEGGDFVHQYLPVASKLKVKLPVQNTWNVGYRQADWSAAVEMSHGFQGSTFHGGVEYRLSMFEFRGGLRYGLDRWHPSGGVGLNLGKRFSIDTAFFGSTTNIERELRPAMALSLRFNRPQD
jgi:hypothetical protein